MAPQPTFSPNSQYRRALALREEALGPDHPSIADPLGWLAYVLQGQGKLEEATDYYKRALAINENTLGRESGGLRVVTVLNPRL